MRIINTGGTWNKIYDPIRGELVVPCDDRAVTSLLGPVIGNLGVSVSGIVYKDSLEMDDADREAIFQAVAATEDPQVLIIHGTDTMEATAAYLARRCREEGIAPHIVLTGSMVPVAIDPREAALHLGMGIAALQSGGSGIAIAMHGIVAPFDAVTKNRDAGRFEKKLTHN